MGYIWNFVGSIGGVLVFYIYPASFYLRLRYMRYRKRQQRDGIPLGVQYNAVSIIKEAIAVAILVIGFLLLIALNYQAISAVVSKAHGPLGQCYQLKCVERGPFEA